MQCHARVEVTFNLFNGQERYVLVQSVVHGSYHFLGERASQRAFQIYNASIDAHVHASIRPAGKDQELVFFGPC